VLLPNLENMKCTGRKCPWLITKILDEKDIGKTLKTINKNLKIIKK